MRVTYCRRRVPGRYPLRMTGKTLLVVDDDSQLRQLVREYLGEHGYSVLVAGDGTGMWAEMAKTPVDMVILDLMLPGEDGLALCRALRARSAMPILMLTARGEETDRIVGLEMGADDYLPKPFSPRELLARIKSILRRSNDSGGTASAECESSIVRTCDGCPAGPPLGAVFRDYVLEVKLRESDFDIISNPALVDQIVLPAAFQALPDDTAVVGLGLRAGARDFTRAGAQVAIEYDDVVLHWTDR